MDVDSQSLMLLTLVKGLAELGYRFTVSNFISPIGDRAFNAAESLSLGCFLCIFIIIHLLQTDVNYSPDI